ncbi:hypothetical protein C2G38_2048790 [Gigaspora rosea]|uniref:Autophagy-related protein 27 n=1 Tax=Gigaspora rosea TaxID=44941 RepID=A0A397U1D3_9GLOM|nr:hypothetical protein C2G38_2048790 [Gigaspora rosea]
MSPKQFIIFIIILILSITFTYSVSYDTIENDTIENDTIKNNTTENDKFEKEDINFFCRNGTSLNCCPHLANRIANEHYSRCASIILINNSGYNMTLNIVNLEDGRWVTSNDYGDDSISINCEPRSLLEHESEAISSVTNHFLGGVQGYVSYIIEDDTSSQFIISWEVSPIGSNKYYFSFLDESYMQDYHVKFEYSLGDTIYQVKIDKKTSLPMSWLISIFLFVFFITIPFVCYQCMSSERKVDGTIGRQFYEPLRHHERQRQQKRRTYSNIYTNDSRYGQQGQSSNNNFNSNDQPPPYHQLFP